jgi:ADP-ribose pyrophosphatase
VNYYEKTEKENTIYTGRIIKVKELNVSLPNGKSAKREIVEHPGAVAILAVTSDKKIVLIKQFRKAVEEKLWEIPAGKLERGESPLACAQRELKEETGYISDCWQKLGEFYASPGFSNEIIHLFIAKNIYAAGSTNFDEDEYMEVYLLSMEEIEKLLREGKIKDAKTLTAILTEKTREE